MQTQFALHAHSALHAVGTSLKKALSGFQAVYKAISAKTKMTLFVFAPY